MRVALCPVNPVVGDLRGNAGRALEAATGVGDGELIVLPELVITGYPPRDLLEQEGFCEAAAESAEWLARELGRVCPGVTVIVGCPWRPRPGARPRNSALVMRGGAITDRYDKRLLPTYDVFDEHRYFDTGDRAVVIEVGGRRVGLAICEDLWRGEDVLNGGRYAGEADPVDELIGAGAELIVCPTASPFALAKRHRQRDIMVAHAARHTVSIASVNQLGGNDDLIFDGCARLVCGRGGSVAVVGGNEPFSGEPIVVELDAPGEAPPRAHEPMEDLWRALVLGVRDYAHKTGFTRACLGLSGGIDSALTATIAVAALGSEHVLGALMPSRYSSEGSITDAQSLGANLGVRTVTLPIEDGHAALERTLGSAFDELCGVYGAVREAGITEENIQSRLRGTIMMALSNKVGALLLTTGNKSELAVGYSTLYGDMNGGLAVLSDVTKVRVFALSRWINEHAARCGFARPPIPPASIEKPPSAELRPDQKDSDSLPEYAVLDEIVERYVEGRQSPERIVREAGIDAATVARVVRLTDVNEYKRKQLAIGLKVTDVAFGRGRRRPIANGWRPEQGVREPAGGGGRVSLPGSSA
ncbi:MAG: NAD+ synthase [Planctomycetota bacterium]